MKYMLILLAFPVLAASECGNKKNTPPEKIIIEEKADTAGKIVTAPVPEPGKPSETKPAEGSQPVPAKDSIPSCVRKLIEKKSKEEPSNLPTRIDEYLFNGKKVYLFTAPCCDQYNDLYDENCNRLCAPTGGFTGRGDNKCPEFSEKAKFVKLIWQMADQ